MTHPNYLALDRLHLGVGNQADRLHAEQCEPCGAYLARLALPVSVPSTLGARPRPGPQRWLGWLAVPVVAALAVLVAKPSATPPEVRTKGSPMVSLLVRRDGVVSRWDGAASVRAGDKLRLEVQPAGLKHLMVFDGTRLLSQDVVAEKAALPTSWRVDEGTRTIELRLIFSREPLTAGAALAAWRAQERSGQRWVTGLTLQVEQP